MQGGLVASCQPVDDGPMDTPRIVAAMAQAAVAGGAAAIRIEGVANLAAARPHVSVPIIGIVKAEARGLDPRITLHREDVDALAEAGADIIAFDATARARPVDRGEILNRIIRAGALAMADCSTVEDATWAAANGAAILGTTLSGYTPETLTGSTAPDLDLVQAFCALDRFVMAEGRYDTPELAALAIANGANAVTVGSVLTRLEVVTGRFAKAIELVQADRLSGFAVDLGGTKTAAVQFERGRIVRRSELKTDGDADPDAQVQLIETALRDVGHEKGQSISVAVTGRVDGQGNWHAVNRGTMKRIDAIPLARLLTDRLGPTVVVNDAAAAALAEHRIGAGKGVRNFAFVTVSTGVGGGLILNGQLVTSPNGLAGHVGFSVAREGTEICGSGRLGTVESIASGRAIGRAGGAYDPSIERAEDVFARAQSGEDWALALINRSACAVGDLIADLVASLGIERVAIGGGVGLAPGYLDQVRNHVLAMPDLFQCEVVAASLGKPAPLYGACLAAS